MKLEVTNVFWLIPLIISPLRLILYWESNQEVFKLQFRAITVK